MGRETFWQKAVLAIWKWSTRAMWNNGFGKDYMRGFVTDLPHPAHSEAHSNG